GEIEGYTSEFHGYLEEQKREAYQKINRLLGDGGVISADMLRDRVVILVSDGLTDVTVLDVAMEFMKSIRINKLVITAPIVAVPVVDKAHILADDIEFLDVKDNYLDTDHYYT